MERSNPGKDLTYRNLDVEPLTEAEQTLLESRAGKIDTAVITEERARRVAEAFSRFSKSKGAYPYRRTNVEQAIAREAEAQEREAETQDPIMRAVDARRQLAAVVSEGYEVPEHAITESDDVDFTKVPQTLVRTSETYPWAASKIKDF